jgi:hypothetical protein
MGQIRDSDEKALAIGKVILDSRLPRSQREAAPLGGLSKSALSRLERGEQTPTLEQLEQLDRGWHKEGSLVSVVQMLIGMPEASARSERNVWLHNFPAKHSGPVWELIRPTPSSPSTDMYRIQIRWGTWEVLTTAMPGTILEHGKGDDGMSYTVTLIVEPPAHVFFGIHAPPAAWPVKLLSNDDWRYIADDRSELVTSFQSKLRHILASCGRTPDELVEFLKLSTTDTYWLLGLRASVQNEGPVPRQTHQ